MVLKLKTRHKCVTADRHLSSSCDLDLVRSGVVGDKAPYAMRTNHVKL